MDKHFKIQNNMFNYKYTIYKTLVSEGPFSLSSFMRYSLRQDFWNTHVSVPGILLKCPPQLSRSVVVLRVCTSVSSVVLVLTSHRASPQTISFQTLKDRITLTTCALGSTF